MALMIIGIYILHLLPMSNRMIEVWDNILLLFKVVIFIPGKETKLDKNLYLNWFSFVCKIMLPIVSKLLKCWNSIFLDVNAQNKDTLWTPLHAATFQEHGKVLQMNTFLSKVGTTSFPHPLPPSFQGQENEVQ